MNKLISSLFSWIDFFIHIYIHITATIHAVIHVAKKSNTPTSAEEMILKRRLANNNNKTTTTFINKNNNNNTQLRRFNNTTLNRKRTKKQQQQLFKKIPNEILLVIFEYMNSQDLYHCSTVTKHWNELTTPILWRSVIPKSPIMPSSPGFPLHVSRYGHAVKSLDLSFIAPHITDTILRYIITTCPQLTSLNLSNCRLITNEGLRCLEGRNYKMLVLENCRQITDIGLTFIKKCNTLETLHLGGCNKLSDNGIIPLVTASGSTIRRINLSDCTRVTGSTLVTIARLCGPRLLWLDISRTKAIRHSHLKYLVQYCPNLTRLNLSLKKQKSLQELSMTTRRQLLNQLVVNEEDEEENINPLHELLDLLHQLNIQPNLTDSSAQHQRLLIEQQKDFVSNKTIELLAIHLKKLQHLNISYWTCLNDKAVHLLSTHSHCLTYLNLIGCQSVTRKVLKYLSDLCERKSTCITLTDLMISPRKKTTTYENSSSWISSSSVSSSSLSEKSIEDGVIVKA